MAVRIKYYMDENIPRAVARGLRSRGIDVVAGMLGATDEEQLRHATADGRVVFTQDEDFLRLHAQDSNHSGIAFAAQGMSIG